MNTEELRRRRAIQRLAYLWPTGWTKHKADAYHDAIADQHPADIEQACADLARTWTEKVLPPPAAVLHAASAYTRQRTAEQQARTEQAIRARGEDTDRQPAQLHVGNRLCHACRGDVMYLPPERMLWCPACRAAQVMSDADGKTRVKLTSPEWEDLHFRRDTRDAA